MLKNRMKVELIRRLQDALSKDAKEQNISQQDVLKAGTGSWRTQ
jgi:hypothetical protein